MLKVIINADSRYPFDRKKVRSEVLAEAGDYLDMAGDNYWLNLLVCGKRKIKELNRENLGHDEVTDVLSFPSSSSSQQIAKDFVHPEQLGAYIGDIVVCFPVARDYAFKRNKLVTEEIAFLARHGVKHLMGVHHK